MSSVETKKNSDESQMFCCPQGGCFKKHPEHNWKVAVLCPTAFSAISLSSFSSFYRCSSGVSMNSCAIIFGLFCAIFTAREFVVHKSHFSSRAITLSYQTILVIALIAIFSGIGGLFADRSHC